VQPCWGGLRPFVLRGGLDVDPGPPLPYSESPASPFFREAKEVHATVEALTDEQRAIARFWADGPGTPTPAGHAVSILSQLVRGRGCTLDVAAEAYARVGIAAADAFVGCWAIKYKYNLLRPVTYIRNVIDPAWRPFLDTPPFPEYVSGHAVQSGATMQVLTDLFGENLPFTDRTHEAPGLAARSFRSLLQAGEEAASSRLYGGIHFRRPTSAASRWGVRSEGRSAGFGSESDSRSSSCRSRSGTSRRCERYALSLRSGEGAARRRDAGTMCRRASVPDLERARG